ncbi:MAG: HD domain-containing protein [Planctomycetes bacterium]|nr:HD domain-containing protein [Planctomycetota bacterium]
MSTPISITKQCTDLAQSLGVLCVPFSLDPKGLRDSAYLWKLEGTFGNASNLVLETVRNADSSGTEQISQLHPEESVFALPLFDASAKWFGVGKISSPTSDFTRLILKIARESLRRGLECNRQLETVAKLEHDLSRAWDERLWLRQLNSDRAKRKARNNHSRQSLESLRSMLHAEAMGLYVYSDVSDEMQGMQSIVVGKGGWQVSDLQQLLQRITKPDCGDSKILNDQQIKLPSGVVYSCVIVPIGDIDASGYLVAFNRRPPGVSKPNEEDRRFDSHAAEMLYELSSFLVIDGQNNLLFKEGEQLVLGTLRAMSNAIEARDPYTHGHSERVAQLAYEIAVRLQLSEVACQEIYLAGILHDIGKIGIPDTVLLKPAKLTDEEFAVIKKHPEIGYRIIEGLGKLRFALPGVLHHHERWDGTGYPYRLRGDQIPLMARIIAVSDAFDAMTSNRIYKAAADKEQAMEILRSGRGTQWDAQAVDACLNYLRESLSAENDLDSNGLSSISNSHDWRLVSRAISVLQL